MAENLREKLLQLNNFDSSGEEASSDGLLTRLADDQLQYPVYGLGDAAVHSRQARSVTDSDVLPQHYRRHISQPPIPFDDGNNVQGRSVCPWRYEDDFKADRFPHTLRVAVKTHTGSRCIDPATGAPRRDLRCLPVEYKLNVLRKDSDDVWQISSAPEFVTVGYTCARSRTA
ncbi:Hypp4254 [Branchiostoma lanceolatum]|uniref:Hypp4254 protein n=1 Tax=Branchiostoma lanceolatum TaxID=7740 RepID=A0A8K0EXN3_BRALA|nr:Hypp4254 [Branchiostoma lanceolatum]